MTVCEHTYDVTVRWTGNTGSGTSGYRDYSRAHTVDVSGKPSIPGSSDPQFIGDRARWNPEELLVAALAACHKLWYLHLCADAGVVVTAYVDRARGFMSEDASGGGRFTRVVLCPEVEIGAGEDLDLATRLHHDAHKLCFIANSVNFPVDHVPTVLASGQVRGALGTS